MRLLFLTPQLPYPPHQGASLRNWAFIQALRRRHEVHLLCFDSAARPAADDGRAVVERHVASLTTVPLPHRSPLRRLVELVGSRRPDLVLRLWTPAFARALDDLLARHPFDLVQVEGLELVRYAERYLAHGGAGPAWVYDAHNAETDLQESAWRADVYSPRRWIGALYSFAQWHKLRYYEGTILPRFDGIVSVSDADAASLAGLVGIEPVVVPNGVDSEALAPGSVAPAPALADRPALVFTGKMDFRPNIDGVTWFVQHVWPRVRTERPEARFWIVGQQPAPAVHRLSDAEGVVVTGRVPEIEPYIAGADVVVTPLRMGSGTRFKVLQALSLARPVVSTPLGCSGLGVVDGRHLRIAESTEAFAEAIVETLAYPDRAAGLAGRGRAYVREHFDWRVLVPTLETLYERIASQPGSE